MSGLCGENVYMNSHSYFSKTRVARIYTKKGLILWKGSVEAMAIPERLNT